MDLAGADLRSAIMDGAHLQNADLSGASPGEAGLRDADLAGADLKAANLSQVRNLDLQGAPHNRATLWPAGFDPTNRSYGLTLVP